MSLTSPDDRDWLWEIAVCPECGHPLEKQANGTELACANHACPFTAHRKGKRVDLLPLHLDGFQKAEDRFRRQRLEQFVGPEGWSGRQNECFQLLNVMTDYIFTSQYLFFRDVFARRYKLDGRGLEIGGGTGHQSGFIKLFYPDVKMVMSDVAPTNLQIAERLDNLLDLGIDYLVACDAQRLPFRPNSFDFLFSSAMLHHLGDLKRGLRQAYSVLKPMGRWYIVNELAIGFIPRMFWNSRWGQKGKTSRAMGIHENSYTLREWKRFFSGERFRVVEMYFHRDPSHKLRSWLNGVYYAVLSRLPLGLVHLGLPCEVCFVLEKSETDRSLTL